MGKNVGMKMDGREKRRKKRRKVDGKNIGEGEK